MIIIFIVIALFVVAIIVYVIISKNDKLRIQYTNANNVERIKKSEELTELFELIQTSTRMIIDARERNRLPTNAAYQLAYFSFFCYFYELLGLIDANQQNYIIAVYSSGLNNQIGINGLSEIARLIRLFKTVDYDYNNKAEQLTSIAAYIEAEILGREILNDVDYLEKCAKIFIDEVKEIITTLQVAHTI